ncbi:hypothetical protein DYB37_009636 [Aphanomyces astaci]|uniref:Kinesin motor domain-containing protein n=1 Tax=Aphanomyces astaci TaxID=112090 RepID=A0A3R7C3M3_APHAT|nr:hypothetical protein DYB35_010020 [Aphanomyces astaci]RHZ13647.1 hypothetical protein DYB37_009636 [Aphanomyces astaci]
MLTTPSPKHEPRVKRARVTAFQHTKTPLEVSASGVAKQVKKSVDVHVRIRPLIDGEVERQDATLSFQTSTTRGTSLSFSLPKTDNDDVEFVEVLGGFQVPKSKPKRDKRFSHFTSVHRDVTNRSFFDATVAPLVDEALAGRTGCCFAYGHTGSGKTHTILGYGAERGMYHLAATQLFAALDRVNMDVHDDQDRVKIQVRFNEVYNGDVYDLLHDGAKCFVREDGHGKVQIRSDTTTDAVTGLVTTAFSSSHLATSETELLAIVTKGTLSRATGNSNVHRASSRSHALLQMELVSDRVLALRDVVARKEAELGRCGYERDSLDMDIFVRQHDKFEGKWVKKADALASTPAECAQLLQFRRLYARLEAEIAAAQADVANAPGLPCVGGAVVFVDLAGSEHASKITDGIQKTDDEQQECREINQSLSALRACFLATARGHRSVSCYRESKLTLALRDHLRAHGGSRTVMIAAISPSSFHVDKTIHTLQYAQMVAQP